MFFSRVAFGRREKKREILFIDFKFLRRCVCIIIFHIFDCWEKAYYIYIYAWGRSSCIFIYIPLEDDQPDSCFGEVESFDSCLIQLPRNENTSKPWWTRTDKTHDNVEVVWICPTRRAQMQGKRRVLKKHNVLRKNTKIVPHSFPKQKSTNIWP